MPREISKWESRIALLAPFWPAGKCRNCGRRYRWAKSTSEFKPLYCCTECCDEYWGKTTKTATAATMGISAGAGSGHPNQGYAGLAGLPGYYTQNSLAAMQANMAHQLWGTQAARAICAPKIDPAKIAALAEAEPRMATAKMPDLVQPIVAWRAWKFGYAIDGKPQLEALGVSGLWEPKKPMAASCHAQSNVIFYGVTPPAGAGAHPAPAKHCYCGMWAFKTREGLLEAADSYGPVVLGEVYLWGRVIETENGYRAQYAYPKELWLLDESLEELGYIYNVPIRTVSGAR